MSLSLHPNQQIARINTLLSRLELLKNLPNEKLQQRKNSSSWSVLEVMKHMSIAHQAYEGKIQKILVSTRVGENVRDTFRVGGIAAYLIRRFPPKQGKIRFKMKTMKKFKPLLAKDADPQIVLMELESVLHQLKGWVNTYRLKHISLQRFSSAIGPLVRFHVPSACEFILCHNERHFQQIDNLLA